MSVPSARRFELGRARPRLGHQSLLSGGEQQCVSIARGLANNPSVILADGPIGNLDPDTAKEVMASAACAVRECRSDHHARGSRLTDRRIRIRDGEDPGRLRRVISCTRAPGRGVAPWQAVVILALSRDAASPPWRCALSPPPLSRKYTPGVY